MAWKDAWTRVFTSGAKVSGVSSVVQEDDNLPLRARVGSVIALQKTPILRAQAQGSLVVAPSDDETLIRAISRVRTEMDGKLYRYYLGTGEDDQAEKFIEVYVNAKDEVAELTYYSRLCRLIPETNEDQAIFSGEAGYGLGDLHYTLWRFQLEDLGWPLDALDATFLDQDHVQYQRMIGDPYAEYVAPFRASETRIDSSDGSQGLRQQLIYVPYVRALAGEDKELLLISTEVVESVNGDRNKRGIFVDFMVGIPIELERLVVQ
ncbi:hypothetical protein RF679_01485 [Undibacterium cyanobacteriorum]|uniref:DUF2491 domain-containing protein n=1 Tax=Undibacterium cyanobacteriorum TaxID=3073561 RepID=A0ABY9RIC7_9BURK|nr:hypothetical protein [Undibacterium sp. 20NA77.5]WMW80969.1 hypothetical protein RF679_01485 [Undibacterium sp. 20NA77.5]